MDPLEGLDVETETPGTDSVFYRQLAKHLASAFSPSHREYNRDMWIQRIAWIMLFIGVVYVNKQVSDVRQQLARIPMIEERVEALEALHPREGG